MSIAVIWDWRRKLLSFEEFKNRLENVHVIS